MDAELNTLRDFLLQYNVVTEMCFNNCVRDFTHTELAKTEDTCTRNCLDKFLRMTQRLATRFQEHQLLQAEVQGAPVSLTQQSTITATTRMK